MFTSYKRHNNELYNNLVKLSRNKFFYQEAHLKDKLETRVLLIFFHFALILCSSKSKKKQKEAQDVFDNIFQNIEYGFRELGYGDVTVNKKMKKLIRIFYDILVSLDKTESILLDKNSYLLKKYFLDEKKKDIVNTNIDKLRDYFEKFQNFCFDLDVKSMLNGSFNFKYK